MNKSPNKCVEIKDKTDLIGSDAEIQFDADESLLFKDPIQNGTYGQPNKFIQKNKSES